MPFHKKETIKQLKKENEGLRAKEELRQLKKERFQLKHGGKIAFAKRAGGATARGVGSFAKKFILPIPLSEQRKMKKQPMQKKKKSSGGMNVNDAIPTLADFI